MLKLFHKKYKDNVKNDTKYRFCHYKIQNYFIPKPRLRSFKRMFRLNYSFLLNQFSTLLKANCFSKRISEKIPINY